MINLSATPNDALQLCCSVRGSPRRSRDQDEGGYSEDIDPMSEDMERQLEEWDVQNGVREVPNDSDVIFNHSTSSSAASLKLPPFCYNAEVKRMMSPFDRLEYIRTLNRSAAGAFMSQLFNKSDEKIKFPLHYSIGALNFDELCFLLW